MKYRRDEKDGSDLSVLGFGCMRLPGGLGRVDIAATERLIMRAFEAGVNYFDTAYLYPGSEEALGEIVERNGIRDKIHIATKLPHTMCKTPEDFDRYFGIQKARLRTDRIDYYLIHNISEFGQWERLRGLGIESWIKGKLDSREILRIGFSFHGPKADFPKLLSAYSWDFCQIQYNYINTDYQAGTDGLRLAHKMGLPVIIMEPLLGGKLAGKLPDKVERAFRAVRPEFSNAAWALRWVWNQAEPSVVLSGMNGADQLEENLRLADSAESGMLTPDELQAVDGAVAAFRETYKVPCTGCNYCMPCPKQINIPASFTAYNSSFSVGRFSGIQAYVISASALSANAHLASSCVKCGKCESHCPQHIAIRKELVAVTKRLEPFPLRQLLALALRFIR